LRGKDPEQKKGLGTTCRWTGFNPRVNKNREASQGGKPEKQLANAGLEDVAKRAKKKKVEARD